MSEEITPSAMKEIESFVLSGSKYITRTSNSSDISKSIGNLAEEDRLTRMTYPDQSRMKARGTFACDLLN
jgi:hypothetical protein